MLEKMKNLVVEEEGQALTEYGLVVGLLVAIVVTAVGVLSGSFHNDAGTGVFDKVASALSGAIK
jgi:pilus assembly protein Flp/PilA